MVGGRRPLSPKVGNRSSKIAHVDRFLPNKCHFFTSLRFEVEQASRGVSATAELLVVLTRLDTVTILSVHAVTKPPLLPLDIVLLCVVCVLSVDSGNFSYCCIC